LFHDADAGLHKQDAAYEKFNLSGNKPLFKFEPDFLDNPDQMIASVFRANEIAQRERPRESIRSEGLQCPRLDGPCLWK